MKWEKSVRLHEEKHTPKKEKDFWRSKLDEAIEDMETGRVQTIEDVWRELGRSIRSIDEK